jgi:uncharacterized protein YhbP (UPF0306 family)
MNQTLPQLVKGYLEEQHMLQLATVMNGMPWCSTVYYIHDNDFNFYWASLPSRRHSKEIRHNPQTAIAVAIKFVNGKQVVGVQAEGLTTELDNPKSIRQIADRYAKKFGRNTKWVEDIASSSTQHRIYKFIPAALFLFDDATYPGGQRQQVI